MSFDRVRRLTAEMFLGLASYLLALVAAAVLLSFAASAAERACQVPEACAGNEGYVQGPSGPVWKKYELVNGVAVIDGDIAVRVLEAGTRGATRPGWAWPNGVIPYVFGTGADVAAVQAAINHWHANTSVTLVPRSGEADYVEFIDGGGCWSYVGHQGGVQQISVAPGCGYGAAVHEIGHAAALWHEQSRLDRDQFVIVHWQNIEPGYEGNFDYYPDGADYGAYDYGSIMHYEAGAFSSNGLPTIESLQAGVTLGQRNGLSAGDRDGIASLYGSGPPNPGESELENGVPVPNLAGIEDEEIRFFMEVPPGAETVQFEINGGTGDADLYVRFASQPTVTAYDCRPFIGGNDESCRFDAPSAGTYHVMVKGYGVFDGVSLVGRYETNVGGLISGKQLRIRQLAGEPGRSRLTFRSTDPVIVPPVAATGPIDARLILANPNTGEVASVELPANSWSRNARGNVIFRGGACTLTLKMSGRLKVSCKGAALGFSLDEPYQSSLAVKLEFNSGMSYCAVFGGNVLRDYGVGWGTNLSAGIFHAEDAPRPSACPF